MGATANNAEAARAATEGSPKARAACERGSGMDSRGHRRRGDRVRAHPPSSRAITSGPPCSPQTRLLAILPLVLVAQRTRDVPGFAAHTFLNAVDLLALTFYLAGPRMPALGTIIA
jgi:hypothetical protein